MKSRSRSNIISIFLPRLLSSPPGSDHSQITHSYRFPNQEHFVPIPETIREAIKQFYHDSGIKDLHQLQTGKKELRPFNWFPEFLSMASMDPRTLSSLKVKQDILFDYKLFGAHKDSLNFDTLLTNTTVFQLKNAPSDDVKRIVTELMINKLIQYSYNLEQSKSVSSVSSMKHIAWSTPALQMIRCYGKSESMVLASFFHRSVQQISTKIFLPMLVAS